MIRFKCGGCGKQYNVPSETAGKQARCKQCGVMFHVPVPQSAVVAADPASSAVSHRAPLATLQPADAPRPVARVVRSVVSPAEDPLGLGINLDTFDPYGSSEGRRGNSPLDEGFGEYRPRKKSNLGLWVLLGGGGVGVIGMIAAAIMLVINNLPATATGGPGTAPALTGQAAVSTQSTPPAMSGDGGVYMPGNWSMCLSMRMRQLIDRSSLAPTLKQQIDKMSADAHVTGVDLRQLDELLYAQDGQITYVAMTFANGTQLDPIVKADRPFETYRGVQLYQGTTRTTLGIANARPAGVRTRENIYSFRPTDRLIVGATDLGRLKSSIDSALSGGASSFSFPRQKMFNMQVKNVKELEGPSAGASNPLTDGIVGFTVSADLNNQLDLAAVLDMKDAPAATNLQSQVNLLLTMAKSQPASEIAPMLNSIQLSASGDQVHVTGSIPYSLLSKAMQPGQTPLAMPGMPWPQGTPMPGQPTPGQSFSGQVPTPGFTPPTGGFQPPQGGSGNFPGSVPGLAGPGLSGRRPGGMRPPTIQPPRIQPPTIQPPRIQPPSRPPRMRPPGRFR